MKQTSHINLSNFRFLHGHFLAISSQELDIREGPAVSLFRPNSTFVLNQTMRLRFLEQLEELPPKNKDF